MIGEDVEIEKDGWLISSIKSSSVGSETSALGAIQSEKDPELLGAYKTLLYFSTSIRREKREGRIAEGLDGLLHSRNSIPGFTKLESDKSSEIDSLVKICNESREVLYRKKSQSQENKDEVKLFYYHKANSGEIIEVQKGKWELKK